MVGALAAQADAPRALDIRLTGLADRTPLEARRRFQIAAAAQVGTAGDGREAGFSWLGIERALAAVTGRYRGIAQQCLQVAVVADGYVALAMARASVATAEPRCAFARVLGAVGVAFAACRDGADHDAETFARVPIVADRKGKGRDGIAVAHALCGALLRLHGVVAEP